MCVCVCVGIRCVDTSGLRLKNKQRLHAWSLVIVCVGQHHYVDSKWQSLKSTYKKMQLFPKHFHFTSIHWIHNEWNHKRKHFIGAKSSLVKRWVNERYFWRRQQKTSRLNKWRIKRVQLFLICIVNETAISKSSFFHSRICFWHFGFSAEHTLRHTAFVIELESGRSVPTSLWKVHWNCTHTTQLDNAVWPMVLATVVSNKISRRQTKRTGLNWK